MSNRVARTLFFFQLVSVFSPLFSVERKVKSNVTSVTVYSDRASVTRRAEEQLPEGEHTLVFFDLPAAVFDQSIRVGGVAEGKGKILDVKIGTIFLDTIPEQRIRDLQGRLKNLKAEQLALNNRMAVLQSQKGFVDTVRISYARGTRSTTSEAAAFDGWERMLNFVEKNLSTIYTRMRETQEKEELVREKIVALEREIRDSQSYSHQSQKQVIVTLRVEASGIVTLELSYVLSGAQWSSLYEARVSPDSKTIQFTYAALVSQSTAEDWSDVDLTLSTAQPSSGSPPELRPWFVDFGRPIAAQLAKRPSTAAQRTSTGPGNTLRGFVRDVSTGEPLIGANVVVEGTMMGVGTSVTGDYVIRNVPSGTYNVRASYLGYSPYNAAGVVVDPNRTTVVDFNLTSTALQMSEVTVTAEAAPTQKYATSTVRIDPGSAQVQAQATSYVFRVPSKSAVPSDDNPHKVTIAVLELPATLSYNAVPRFSRSAFLKAKVKNVSEYPFLAGGLSVFFENSFVATSELRQTLPGEEFEAGLGVDEGIRTERKLLNKFTEYTGTFTRKTRISYDYAINVENAKKVKVDVKLQEQIPISRNEKIVVELTSPSSDELRPDQNGALTWNLNLAPSEKRELKLKFSVEFPADMYVAGLE